MKNLVIVESPTKAKTIQAFLPDSYEVVSSYGHVRDLPKGDLGVNVDEWYEPRYVIPMKARKGVSALKKAAAKAGGVILATDEDREGEAIAWHLAELLNLHDIRRIAFHEITKSAIQDALKHPREINMALVDAQQARRVLDRLVGYKLSPFLWKKVAPKLSAGRVQSAALRMIVDREREIRAFYKEAYFTISADFGTFVASLVRIGSDDFPVPGIKNKQEAEAIVRDLERATYTVAETEEKEMKRNPLPPFITSTLQQEASRRLHFSSRQTMRLAQTLYERGLITYMRTDSVNLSREALAMAHGWIAKELGSAYVLPTPRVFSKKSRLAQEAHEAIRPTSLVVTPPGLERREAKLYELIWARFVASQLPPAVFMQRRIDVAAEETRTYLLRASGRTLVFDGYLRVWKQKFEEQALPTLATGASLTLRHVALDEHETEPPPRYNEASLIKALENAGIGRPSTYASIISVLELRNYVEKDNGRRFVPTEIGELVTQVLTEHFPAIVDIDFTAHMEEDLDHIAEGTSDWRRVVDEFYKPFSENLERKYDEVQKQTVVGEPQKTDVICDKCGKPMVVKTSRFGKFLACTGFPECRNTKPYIDGTNSFGPCPKCGEGMVIRRRTRKGRVFYGCSRYPDCDYASWTVPGAEKKKSTG